MHGFGTKVPPAVLLQLTVPVGVVGVPPPVSVTVAVQEAAAPTVSASQLTSVLVGRRSSFTIVPTPCRLTTMIGGGLSFIRLTRNVSFSSKFVSPQTWTGIGLVRVFLLKVSVPLVAT